MRIDPKNHQNLKKCTAFENRGFEKIFFVFCSPLGVSNMFRTLVTQKNFEKTQIFWNIRNPENNLLDIENFKFRKINCAYFPILKIS